MTLLSLLFAAPASADTVTPVRDCWQGDGYHDLDGEYSAMAAAPDGYLIASYCVDSDGRRGRSEVHTLEPPQSTTTIWSSEGRPLRGYSMTYVKPTPSEQPGNGNGNGNGNGSGNDDDENEGSGNGSGGNEEPTEPEQSEPTGQSSQTSDDESTPAGGAEKAEQPERTPRAPASESEPSRSASAEVSVDGSQMTTLTDGEELVVTPIAQHSDDDDESMRTLIVAGSIIIVGLLAGAIALLVRLPGQR